MQGASREVHERMALVARVVERLCQLPAAPSADWCQRAAAELLPLGGDTLACVMVATHDAAGRPESVEDAGAAGGVRGSREALGRVLGPEAGAWTLAMGLEGPERVRRVELSSLPLEARERWRAAGAEALLVVSEALWAGESARRVTATLASPGDEGLGLAAAQAAVSALARRVGLAFGRKPLHPSSRLTAREMEVLERLLLGWSIKKIAEDMGRSPHTVHDHVKSLHTKLGATSRGALVARALGHLAPGGEGAAAEGVATPGGLRAVVKPVSLASLRV